MHLQQNPKFAKYLEDICNKYALVREEAYSLFLSSVASAYNGFGSAYIWEDGTITIGIKENNRFRLKNYVISAKKYTEITSIFSMRVEEYSRSRDVSSYLISMLGKIYSFRVVNTSESYIYLEPIDKNGFLVGLVFRLKNNRVFYKEVFSKGDIVKAVVKNFDYDNKIVNLGRFDKRFCEITFNDKFNKQVEIVGLNYEVKSIGFYLDFRSKRVDIFLVAKSKPNKYFIEQLNSSLKDEFKRCRLIVK